MSENDEKESIYPIWSACSFASTDFYEEASADLEESRNFAFIPERCCLLNDVIYPLDYVEEFYWAPWKSVQCDNGFFLRESEKVEKKLMKICTNIPTFSDIDELSLEEEFPESGDLFDAANFKELELQTPSDNENYGFLEVPYISNHALHSDFKIPLNELLRNITSVEVEDIFKKEINLEFDKWFEEEILENEIAIDDFDNFSGNHQRFKEIFLSKIPEEDLSLEFLFNPKNDNLVLCSRTIQQSNIQLENDSKEQLKLSQNLIQPCQNLYADASQSDDSRNFINFENSENFGANLTSKSSNESTPFDEDGMSERQLDDKSSILSYSCEMETSEIEEYNSDDFIYSDDEDFVVKITEKLNDSFSEICNDDFFSEPFMDSNDDFDNILHTEEAQTSNIQSVSELKSISFRNSPEKFICDQSREKMSFLEKLSHLNLIQEVPDNDSFIPKDIIIGSENVIKSSTVYKNKTLKPSDKQNDKCTSGQLSKPQFSSGNEIKTDIFKNQEPFNLLSHYFWASKKENELLSSIESRFSESQASQNSPAAKNETNLKNYKTSNKDIDLCCEENSFPMNDKESKVKLHDEDISVVLPDDYVQLVLVYEKSAMFYIQKLALWEKFKITSDLTIVDISLDKTRFLLNQEVKNCRDRNINPLDGGVRYSHYIQLLVLHGILKSLNCLIHFGAQLANLSLQEYEVKHTGVLKVKVKS